MEAIFREIKERYAKADDNDKREIQGYIRELQVDFYTDWDVIMRLTSGPLQVALLRVGVNLDLFNTLMKSEGPVTLTELVNKTGASKQLLTRILRTMAAFGQVKETGHHEYGPSAFTRIFSDPNAAGALCQLFDVTGPATQALPEFLKETKYQNITSKYNTVFQKAFNTDLSMFEWMPQHPEHMKSLGQLMALDRPTHWVDSYPIENLGSLTDTPDKPVLVDIGGGFGQQAIAFRNKFPHLAGRIVVQDIPSTLAGAQPTSGIEFVHHDFFGPQPIKGAKLYYLRHVLHDWPDAESIRILRNIIPSMGPDSRLIIDEVVLPETAVPWQAAYMDLLMMNNLAGVERTRAEWESVMDQAGLKIVEVHQYDPKMQSVIVMVPK